MDSHGTIRRALLEGTSLSLDLVLVGLPNSLRILPSVHNNNQANTNAVYAAVISSAFTLHEVFRSNNRGGNWTALAPAPAIFPGTQGELHGAIVADPTDANVVFIGGDRQAANAAAPFFPNANGCNDYSGNLFESLLWRRRYRPIRPMARFLS